VGELTFYFDRCFGKRFPEALWKAKPPFSVEWHHSKKNNFPQNIQDDEWLTIVGPKEWVVFSHDRKFHDESPSVAAIKQHNIGCFYLWGAQAETWEKMRYFIRRYDSINALVSSAKRPFIYHIGLRGKLKRVPIP
jgi:hypothetical protein